MNQGDVALVDWPFSDRQGSKTRPAIVVQADFLNGVIDDTVLVMVTGTKYGIPNTEVLLDPAVEMNSGLTRVCVASCLNVTTVEQMRVYRTIGYLSDAAMRQIEACLKTVLELP